MKLQVDFPEDINLKLKIYKIKHKLNTLDEAMNKILFDKFEADDIKKNKKTIELKEENKELKKKLNDLKL